MYVYMYNRLQHSRTSLFKTTHNGNRTGHNGLNSVVTVILYRVIHTVYEFAGVQNSDLITSHLVVSTYYYGFTVLTHQIWSILTTPITSSYFSQGID